MDICKIIHNKCCPHIFTCKKCRKYQDIITSDTRKCIDEKCNNLQCPYCVKNYDQDRYNVTICSTHYVNYIAGKKCGSCSEEFPRSMGRFIRLLRITVNSIKSSKKRIGVCIICFNQLKVLSDVMMLKNIPKYIIEQIIMIFISI